MRKLMLTLLLLAGGWSLGLFWNWLYTFPRKDIVAFVNTPLGINMAELPKGFLTDSRYKELWCYKDSLNKEEESDEKEEKTANR